MKEKLAKFDKGFARGEAALAVIVLLSLVLVAAVQALLRNLADAEVAWATSALADVGWVDAFMQRATLWLAMLGASLATHYDKHIGIDILARIAKPKARALMRGTVALFAMVVLGLLVWSGLLFWALVVFFIAGRSGVPPQDAVTPLGPGRRWLGWATFALLGLILLPVPHFLSPALGLHCPYL